MENNIKKISIGLLLVYKARNVLFIQFLPHCLFLWMDFWQEMEIIPHGCAPP